VYGGGGSKGDEVGGSATIRVGGACGFTCIWRVPAIGTDCNEVWFDVGDNGCCCC